MKCESFPTEMVNNIAQGTNETLPEILHASLITHAQKDESITRTGAVTGFQHDQRNKEPFFLQEETKKLG